MYSVTTIASETMLSGRQDDPTIHAEASQARKFVDGVCVVDSAKPPEVWLRFERGNLALCLSLVEAGKVIEELQAALLRAASMSWTPAAPEPIEEPDDAAGPAAEDR